MGSPLGWSLVLALVLSACGGGPAQPRDVPFTSHGATSQSGYDGGSPRVLPGERAPLFDQPASVAEDRFPIAVFQGQKPTGGYAIRVDRMERIGSRLHIHATFTEPGPDVFVIQVLTSPAELVSIAPADAAGVDTFWLFDQDGQRVGEAPR